MNTVKKTYGFLRDKYRLLTKKKYTTLAGTLVFFFVMSVVPFAFWLTLLLGKLPIDGKSVWQLPVFQSVENVFTFVRQEAQNATRGVSLVLLLSSLYSSTNLFYQMRRSGEIIYEYRRLKAGLRIRIGALVLTGIIILIFLVFFAVYALGSLLFSRFFNGFWERVADYSLLLVLAFALVLLLNMYICPYKMPMRNFLHGTCITVTAWILVVTGFSVYLQVSNMDKLYGALTTLIVFLLWLYVLMICFIVGVIFNSEKVKEKRGAASRKKSTRKNK
ncbi:MAG: YihY/virulence factor BrkB family protein [Clostridiales bacterium]|nr:YihY/virulence factor BrkB family protein [Clostridiales bacterium]